MKKKFFLILLTAILAYAACGNSADNSPVNSAAATIPDTNTQAFVQDKLDEKTEKALLEALADERRAFAEYEAVVEKFGDVRPFSNIVKAEKRHESFLLPLFEKYGLKAPENEFTKEKALNPATVAEACQNGVKGEKANIAMYNKFLEFVKETDIRETFTYLRDASEKNHLPAFERCGGAGGKKGRGRNT
jgi:rubrerythrin